MDYIEQIKSDSPAHMQETIFNYASVEKRADLFALEVRWSDSASVNVYEVTGSCHPDYVGSTWMQLLDYGKRMPRNMRLLHENPLYYFEQTKKIPSMYYTKIGKDLFVTCDGNHRTCLAKVLFFYSDRTNIEGVFLTEIIKDEELEHMHELLNASEELKKAGIRLEIQSKHLSRKDAPGWKSDIKKPVIIAQNKSYQAIEMNASDALDFYTELKSGHFLRLLRHNKYAKFIKG